jgi:hypothetical protein
MENPTNRQPQTNENYPDSVNFDQEALRMQNNNKEQMPEKTWDGPLGEVAREASTAQGYAQPEAEPRPEIQPKPHTEPEIQPAHERPDTGVPNPLGNPDSQSEEEHNKSSEEVEEESVEHSEKGNLNDMRGYNEPKSKESEFYK